MKNNENSPKQFKRNSLYFMDRKDHYIEFSFVKDGLDIYMKDEENEDNVEIILDDLKIKELYEFLTAQLYAE